MSLYGKLYRLEQKAHDENWGVVGDDLSQFHWSKQIQPFVEHLKERV